MSESSLDGVLPQLGEILADDLRVLHDRRAGAALGGGDVDCAVHDAHEWWPLRLERGIRLCQCLRYDVTANYYVFDVHGEVIAVDCLDDRRGIGKYGFPTRFAFDQKAGSGSLASPAIRAAYLTAKRLRKRIVDPREWSGVSDLARVDADGYSRSVMTILGRRLGSRVAETVLSAGRPPDGLLFPLSRCALHLRRYRSPLRVVEILLRGSYRVFYRVTHPTGLTVLIAGPDGVGKSTLAGELATATGGLFRGSAHFHGHASLLPRPGALLLREAPDVTHPHARDTHGTLISFGVLLYQWMDTILGHLARVMPTRIRSRLVVLERGFWDVSIDPRRYRIGVPARALRAFRRFVPRPDLVLLLEGPPAVLHDRKPELPLEEIERQSREWGSIFPTGTRVRVLDAESTREMLVTTARREVAHVLEERQAARLEAGWTSLKVRGTTRFYVPRGSRKVARAALRLYNPPTPGRRVLWEAARVAALLGFFRLVPRGDAPPREVREVLAPHLPRGATISVAKATHPDRFIALVLEGSGKLLAVAKVATSDQAAVALERERATLERYAGALPPPLALPRVLDRSEQVLVLEPIEWRPRTRPWVLEPDVASALGRFWADSAPAGSGAAHGDLAPWNLLQSPEGWTLIDWEFARDDAPPFYDLFHYLVQSHVMLGKPTAREIVDAVHRRTDGWIARAISGYAAAARLPETHAAESLVLYLSLSETDQELAQEIPEEARRIRRRLKLQVVWR